MTISIYHDGFETGFVMENSTGFRSEEKINRNKYLRPRRINHFFLFSLERARYDLSTWIGRIVRVEHSTTKNEYLHVGLISSARNKSANGKKNER